MIDEDGELQISGKLEDISIPFVPRNAKSLPSSPVKPHEAVPLSEYGGRAEKEEVAPEVVQSWGRETILDTDISQVAPTSESTSITFYANSNNTSKITTAATSAIDNSTRR